MKFICLKSVFWGASSGLFFLLSSCGDGSSTSSVERASVNLAPTSQFYFSTAPTLVDGAGGRSVTPKVVPQDRRVAEIKLTWSVRLDGQNNDTFTYDTSGAGWCIAIVTWSSGARSGVDSQCQSKGIGVEVSGGSEKLYEGKVNITYRPPDGVIPENFVDNKDNPKRMVFQLYYSASQSGYDGADNVKGVTEIEMKEDRGIIKNGAVLGAPGLSDRTIVARWESPSTASVDIQNGAVVDTNEAATVASTVVMFWDVEKCKEAGTWAFKTNAYLGEQRTVTCSYPTTISEEGMCNVGLGCENGSENIAGQNPLDILVPAEIPTEAGVGGGVTSGCYTVYKTESTQTSFAVSNLEDGRRYGMMVWPVNASGRLGKSRSNCRFAAAADVPLFTGELNDSAAKSKECFVATAASGSTNSSTVFYWRFIRDVYLSNTGFIGWYYEQGPKMAEWLEENSGLKTPVNFVLETSGKLIFKATNFFYDARETFSKLTSQVGGFLSRLFFDVAYAQESEPSADAPAEPSVEVTPVIDAPPSAAVSEKNSETTTTSDSQNAPAAVSPTPSAEPTPAVEPVPEPVSTPSSVITPAPSTVTPATAEEKEFEGFDPEEPGSASSTLQLSFSILKPSENAELYKHYYPKQNPYRIHASQSFRVFDFFGEFGAGLYGNVITATGKVPSTRFAGSQISEALVGQEIGFYSIGVGALVDYRLRIGASPYFSPRVTFGGGYERTREEAAAVKSKNETGKVVGDGKSYGYTKVGPTAFGKLSLELSLPELFGGESVRLRHAYDVEDFMLHFYGEYVKDFVSGERVPLGGLYLGGGVSLLFF